jgi:DNA-nicking Smr family endonuclease
MARRNLSDRERDLFESAMSDSAPLKKSSRPRKKPAPALQPAPTLSHAPKKMKEKPAPLTAIRHTVGIDGNTAERLRRGQVEPHARLDLHGMSERDAHRALVTFVRAARMRNLRLVLIVTGKGGDTKRKAAAESVFDLGLDMRMRGVLRSLTPRWLREPALAEMVVDVREAHRRHGGSGALYVYLRKSGER